MLSKSFTLLLFCLSTILIISATPAEDANAAFQDIIAFATEILNTKYNETTAAREEVYQRLDTIQLEALVTLDRKLTDFKAKIAEIENNLVTLNIDGSCVYPAAEVDSYQASATTRILQCTDLSRDVVANIFAATWADFTTQQGDYLGCIARSLGHCQGYAVDDRCFEHIVALIQTRKINLQNALERIDLNFHNKLASFQMPCQKMIDLEVATYPDFFLPYMSQCAENTMKLTRPYVCANVEL